MSDPDWNAMDMDELRALYTRLCTLERGHELYGKTADDYGREKLTRHLDQIEEVLKRRQS